MSIVFDTENWVLFFLIITLHLITLTINYEERQNVVCIEVTLNIPCLSGSTIRDAIAFNKGIGTIRMIPTAVAE